MAQEIGDNSLIETWASTGNVIEPPLAKQNGGWEFEEQPPHEYMNWIHNTLGKQVNYLMRSGVPAWNAATSYLTGNAVIESSVLWIALAPNSNSLPTPANANWQGIDANTFATAAQGALADTALQAVDIGDFETSAQLDVRDAANRARANHTGTQAISTVTGLQSALDGKAELSHTHTLSQITDAGTAAAADVTDLALPAGAVQMFARQIAPVGWLKCDGTAVSRTTYADLFTAIGETFGAGDGSTTFNVPDLRGEFVRGWDDGRGVDPGRAFGGAQAGEIQSHSHTVLNVTTSGTTFSLSDNPNNANLFGVRQTNATGGSETRPRNVALLYCIKV